MIFKMQVNKVNNKENRKLTKKFYHNRRQDEDSTSCIKFSFWNS